MGLKSCLAAGTSHLLLIVTSCLFFAIGIALVAGCFALAFSELAGLVPRVVVFGGLAVGFAVVVLGGVGCRQGLVPPRRSRHGLGIFLLGVVAIAVAMLGSSIYMVIAEVTLGTVHDNGFEALEQRLLPSVAEAGADLLRESVHRTFRECDASVTPLALPAVFLGRGHFVLNCSTPTFESLALLLNQDCLGVDHAVDFAHNSSWYSCYSAQAYWPWPLAPSASATNRTIEESMLNTPKGLFCQCSRFVTGVVLVYLYWGKFLGVSATIRRAHAGVS